MRSLLKLLVAAVAAAAVGLAVRYHLTGEAPGEVLAGLREWRAGPAPSPTPPGGEGLRPPPGQAERRVLFLGNSLVYSYGMPNMLERMAWSAGINLRVTQHTPGGWTLAQHAAAPEVRQLLSQGGWEAVVLQEQSQLPSWADAVVRERMFPPARSLAAQARAGSPGARLVLYQTPARRSGDAANARAVPEVATYAGMQARINAAYRQLAAELGSTLAPAGQIWQQVREARPGLLLYGDEAHPNGAGAYLIACVFYAVLTRRSPAGNAFIADLDPATARYLQEAAGAAMR